MVPSLVILNRVNREAAKISALSSGKGKTVKCEYLTGYEILPFDQRRVIEQAKYTYSPLWKALEKETKLLNIKEKKASECLKNFKAWYSTTSY